MRDINDINSILNAINEINLKPKKKKTIVAKKFTPELNQDLEILPEVNKLIPKVHQDLEISPEVNNLIQEAEEYKKNILRKSPQVDLLPSNKHILKNNNHNKNILKDDVLTSLKIQDSSILIQNEKIKNLKRSEEKLILQITDLEQDKTILQLKIKKFELLADSKININNTKENLKSIYKQVEKQKKIFMDLKNYSIKTKQDSNLYKENYEKLVIENNDIKLRLASAKDQIVVYENNKQDLLISISQLNDTLFKTNIVTTITPYKSTVEEISPKKKKI